MQCYLSYGMTLPKTGIHHSQSQGLKKKNTTKNKITTCLFPLTCHGDALAENNFTIKSVKRYWLKDCFMYSLKYLLNSIAHYGSRSKPKCQIILISTVPTQWTVHTLMDSTVGTVHMKTFLPSVGFRVVSWTAPKLNCSGWSLSCMLLCMCACRHANTFLLKASFNRHAISRRSTLTNFEDSFNFVADYLHTIF